MFAKTKSLPHKEYMSDQRWERTNKAATGKILSLWLISSYALALCIDTHLFTISKVTGMNEKKWDCCILQRIWYYTLTYF